MNTNRKEPTLTETEAKVKPKHLYVAISDEDLYSLKVIAAHKRMSLRALIGSTLKPLIDDAIKTGILKKPGKGAKS